MGDLGRRPAEEEVCACAAGNGQSLRVYGCTGSGVWRYVRPEVAHLSAELLNEMGRARMHAGRSWGCSYESGHGIGERLAALLPAALHDGPGYLDGILWHPWARSEVEGVREAVDRTSCELEGKAAG